jgi:hypothetical protein
VQIGKRAENRLIKLARATRSGGGSGVGGADDERQLTRESAARLAAVMQLFTYMFPG